MARWSALCGSDLGRYSARREVSSKVRTRGERAEIPQECVEQESWLSDGTMGILAMRMRYG
jgi:hypothetical protein